VQDVRQKYAGCLAAAGADSRASDRLCELNVIEQVANVCQTSIARDAWERGQELTVHAWVYGISDGIVRGLDLSVSAPAELSASYEKAIANMRTRLQP